MNCRYVCGPEAAHRIFSYDIHHRTISVERLPFHLPNQKPVTFKDNDDLDSVCRKARYRNSKLEAFLQLCREDVDARQYTYQEIPEYYVWNSDLCEWKKRKRGIYIGRLTSSHYAAGELWFLRMLLIRVRGPTSFSDLRKVGNTVYSRSMCCFRFAKR